MKADILKMATVTFDILPKTKNLSF